LALSGTLEEFLRNFPSVKKGACLGSFTSWERLVTDENIIVETFPIDFILVFL